MELVLNSWGTYINKSGKMFEIKKEDKKKKISPLKVSSIIISPGITLSSDVMEMALKHNIDIVMLNNLGKPIGRFWHAKMGSTAQIRRAQLQLADSSEGLRYGTRWVIGKFQNQIKYLESTIKRRTRHHKAIKKMIRTLEQKIEDVQALESNINEVRNTILGIEGSAGQRWWKLLSRLVPQSFQFNGRSYQPAQDEFNAMLNYGYGMLYGKVEKRVVIAGLDPYIGFIHTDNYNKISFVFDVIEKYRPWIDMTIMKLIGNKKVKKKTHFKEITNGIFLGEEGKKMLVPAVNEFLDSKIRYNGKNQKRKDIIQKDLHSFASQILEKYEQEGD